MTAVAVVIPAHDEAELLDRCLGSVAIAVDTLCLARPGTRAEVVVVLDACTDDSHLIAARWPVTCLTIDERCVGAARAEGARSALARLADVPASRIWLAHTDADSAVPPNWLEHQLAEEADGADVVLGTVRPDFADLTARHAAYWTATHAPGRALGNVHGANLGIRASTYLDVGGFPPLTEHEDVTLVRRAEESGAVVRAAAGHEVLTSGRRVGRTPGGYAAFVRRVHERLTDQGDVA